MRNTFLWGVAVLEPDSHPDNNKGPDPETRAPYSSLKTHPLRHSFQPHYNSRQPTLTVLGNELRLFWAKIFPLLILLMSCI